MHFDNSYFKDEIREGFYIAGMVKRSWAAQMETLSKISDICRKYDIKWFADCGTLIGAVRHGGFIPWDDDLDICMIRDDYDKFVSVVRDEIPTNYTILNLDLNPQYNDFLTRIVSNDSIEMSSEFLEKNNGFPYTAGVDIFPFDYLYEDEQREAERKKRAEDMWNAAAAIDYKDLKQLREIDKIFRECKGPTSRVAIMPVYVQYDARVYPIEYFNDIIQIPFENIMINVPASYIEVLNLEYGNWFYTTKKGGVHNYPFYKKQEDVLIARNGNAPYVYCYTDRSALLEEARAGHAAACGKDYSDPQKITVFLPTGPDEWEGMKPLYDELALDVNNNLFVMPVPYAYRDNNGNPLEWIVPSGDFLKDVSIIPYDKYDFAHIHADIFVIANPFDEYESGFTVHPFFYSENLRKVADNLIFCHTYDIDDFEDDDNKSAYGFRRIVISPGVMNSGLICVPDENVKRQYLRALGEEFGVDSLEEWYDKILVIDNHRNRDEEKTLKSSGKKQMLFYASFSDIYDHGEDALDWIEESLNLLSEHNDKLDTIWIMRDEDDSNVEKLCPDIYERYSALKTRFASEIGRIESALNTAVIDESDAFYGSPGYIMHQCVLKKIPVMVRRNF